MGNARSLKQRSLICLMVVALSLPAFAAQDTATELRAKPILSEATYRGLRPGRFMTKWLVLGCVQTSAQMHQLAAPSTWKMIGAVPPNQH